ncbi:hypothetical protein CV102_10070 [Natronococcus pandeyae]|uniref:DUF8118 domain-containing protein n=1 Tax=Natronococcus pandeyae TaxID=2055836 RepID=A0A8J8Q4V6_9EURY|nr:hypothetical protein [Natronococcus pandeyae]TYL38847.1 hypothetical protein CV102_10070 [Natronococcus pandeyae]
MNEFDPDTDGRTDNAASSDRPRTDGEALIREADAQTDICEEDDDPWTGPYIEYGRDGTPTGTCYSRCRGCGREVLAGIDKRTVSHRDECRFGAERYSNN